jgi:DNA-damage-inducible protein D
MSTAITPGDASKNQSAFERIKHATEDGFEYWHSRELALVCEYTEYRNFEGVIERAKVACATSGHAVDDHFGDTTDMIDIGKGAQRQLPSILLSRYACYLTIQAADNSKPAIALGQTYFAIQTRRQELADASTEDERRVLLREELASHNAQLASAAKACGVVQPIDYAIFQNHGYMGLYGGLTAQDLHKRRGLKKSQKILDHMGATELAANLFRATQAEEKLKRDVPQGKDAANRVHREVGETVRRTIEKLGGTMPEHLPPAECIKKVAKKLEGKRKEVPNLPADDQE